MKSIASNSTLAFLFIVSIMNAYAQPPIFSGHPQRHDINVTIINPTGFLAPGESTQLYILLENPADSGIVVEDATGGGFSTRPSPEIPPGTGRLTFVDSDLCSHRTPCPVERDFPLQPGESLILAFKQIHAYEGLPIGANLGMSYLHLGLRVDGENIDVPSRNLPLYIVTADGTGDYSLFNQHLIQLPSIYLPVLSAELTYPKTLTAGEHFNLRAEITNIDSVGVPFLNIGRYQVEEFVSIGQFKHIPCETNCILAGGHAIEPGESVVIDLGNYYYNDELLQDDQLVLPQIELTFFDEHNRLLTVAPRADPVVIEINGPTSGPVPNPALEVPERQALQVLDLIEVSDQLIVHDPNTGNDWIRLTATESFSVAELEEFLTEIADFGDFEIARESQVEELLLNHAHAQFVSAATHDLGFPPAAVNDVLYDFLELIGQTQPLDGSSFLRITTGVVANHPPLDTQKLDPVSLLSISATRIPVPSLSRGADTVHVERSDLELFNSGYWLVSTPPQPHDQFTFLVSLEDDEIMIPSIKVGEDYYEARFALRDSVSGLLYLTGLAQAAQLPDAPLYEFNLDTGLLNLPFFAVKLGSDEYATYRGTLQLLPGSDPPLFSIVEVEEL